MRIVLDTNVVISAVFFGGVPRKILESIIDNQHEAYATLEIVDEYQEIVEEMIAGKQGKLRKDILLPLIKSLNIIPAKSKVEICRDSDDNKFLGCAKDSDAIYIVSGDKDLLVLKQFGRTKIITAKEFWDKYLNFK